MVADQQLQRLHELVAIGVVQAGVALLAVIDEHFAAGVGQDRRADGKRLEREERQALVRRRHDDDRRRFERLERSSSDSRPAKRTNGSSGSGISLTPISTSDASPPSCT